MVSLHPDSGHGALRKDEIEKKVDSSEKGKDPHELRS